MIEIKIDKGEVTITTEGRSEQVLAEMTIAVETLDEKVRGYSETEVQIWEEMLTHIVKNHGFDMGKYVAERLAKTLDSLFKAITKEDD
jgi:hypothetical protein